MKVLLGSSPKYRVLLSVLFGTKLLAPCKIKELFVRIVLFASGCSMKCWCPGLEQSKKARKKVAKALGKLVLLRPQMLVCPGCLGVLLRVSSSRAGVATNISIHPN